MVATKVDNTNSQQSNNNNNNRKKNVNKSGNMKNKMKNRNKRVVCNMRAGIGAMFNPSQMLDNPGYMDFNEPDVIRTPPIIRLPIQPSPIPSGVINKLPQRNNGHNHNNGININNNKNQRINRRQQTHQRRRQGGWGVPPPNMPPVPSLLNQRPLPPGGPFRGPMPPPRMHPMGPPMSPMRPPMPLMPPPSAMNGRFGPRPPLPPLMGRPPIPLQRAPPLGLGPLPPPRPLIPRTNGAHQIGIGPIGSGGGGGLGPMRRNKNRRNNRNKKNKSQNPNKPKLPQLQNQNTNKSSPSSITTYSLDKPWVNDEIRGEFKKKEDLENKLKGNRNDKLFAEFKVQRDNFVKMYEAARIEFIGKHPEQDVEKIMTESDKPETQTNNNLNKTNTSSSTIATTTTTANNSKTSNTNTAES